MTLVTACAESRRVRLTYGSESGRSWTTEADPWSVVVRHGRWYLLCHSHHAGAQRAYRIDRVLSAETLATSFAPPPGLDPVAMLEEHLAVGWEFPVEVLIAAPAEEVVRRLPAALGRVAPVDGTRCRLTGSTSNPRWYAEQLAAFPVPYRIVQSPELVEAARAIAAGLLAAVDGSP
jgi:predicted DNA-binding transcriptional regulator YafY